MCLCCVWFPFSFIPKDVKSCIRARVPVFNAARFRIAKNISDQSARQPRGGHSTWLTHTLEPCAALGKNLPLESWQNTWKGQPFHPPCGDSCPWDHAVIRLCKLVSHTFLCCLHPLLLVSFVFLALWVREHLKFYFPLSHVVQPF